MWVDLKAGPVEYEDVGEGPVIVLAHGVLVDSSAWRHVVPTLADRARRKERSASASPIKSVSTQGRSSTSPSGWAGCARPSSPS